ncbi:putative cyclin-a3-1 [Phtheirospermum japonicum]|uniref:Putative cyclin-a3-1 n=1 Tax=Phtheirospermum japonicum TaxID=374723 RepID=A0A830BW93_9LAMI|nr:putative cyclin-a3-1 [Phtheirospermum japonicum]
MADGENQIPTEIKAPRKRPIQSAEGYPAIKKRVVLRELTNISSDVSGRAQNPGMGKTRKRKPEPVSEKTRNETNIELVVSSGSDEPQNIGYASSIFQHLHSLETIYNKKTLVIILCELLKIEPKNSARGPAPEPPIAWVLVLPVTVDEGLDVEAKRRPLSNYMEKVQDDLNPAMRSKLVNWLVEVADDYNLVSDTLYLTVNYIDRYLSAHKLVRNKLQLLGVSCMLVASKYEEISPLHIEDFCFTKDEVVDMERDVLKLLDFEMGYPTAKSFLRIFTRAAQDNHVFSNLRFNFLCYYLAELSLLDYGCIRYIPSMVAASAIFLARLTIQPKSHPWTLTLQKSTGYKPYELKECVLRLHNLLLRTETSALAVRQKYMDHKFKCVASMSPPLESPASFFEVPHE